MKIEEFLLLIKNTAIDNGLNEPLLVGGVPRDRIIGRIDNVPEIRDIDITTGNKDAKILGTLLANKFPGSNYREFDDGHVSLDIFGLHIDFSSHFVAPGIDVELTKKKILSPTGLQKEIYSRDFTINTVMETLDFSNTIDLTGTGISDIHAGFIRCPIDPDVTIRVDSRRILRAIKFAIKFGFSIEHNLKNAMIKYSGLVELLPSKFVSSKIDEIVRINPDLGIDMLLEYKLLSSTNSSKMVNDILIQKRKVLQVLSFNYKHIHKTAAIPAFDFRPINNKTKQLTTKVQSIPPNTTLTEQDQSVILTLIKEVDGEIEKLKPTTMSANDGKVPRFWRRNQDYGGNSRIAFVRGNCGKPCPFGLKIPQACLAAGKTTNKMVCTEHMTGKDKEKYNEINDHLYSSREEDKSCVFADKIFSKKFNKVDCDFGDNAQGIGSPNIQPSPLYPGTFNSLMLSGIHSGPSYGWYSDNDSSRNMFFGLYSYVDAQNTNTNNILKLSFVKKKTK